MSDRLDFPLHGLAVYNPQLLSKDELVRFFVARQRELDRLIEALQREAEGQPQHHLVVGARGMGKTTLLNRLRYAIEDDPQLRERCLGLVFPEEQYNIGNLADFWLNCVDALADVLEHQGQDELPQELDEQIAHLQSLPQTDDRGRRGLELLCTLADRLDRRLVLLVDNIDLVIDRLPNKEDWALRQVLSEESRIQLVGGTSAPFESYYSHDKAFYDFFRIHQLQGLNDDETFTVLRRLAETTGHDHITHLLNDDPARIRTLRLMAGGNPRTVVILFNLLAKDVNGNVRSDLEQLLDYCTPLYKHRLDALPPQAQRVVDALAMHWDPVNAATIAKTTHLPVNVVSTQLNRLTKEGTVEKVALPGTKRLGFQIAERFFNIWCLMRASRRVRRRLGWLVEFLRTMLEPEDLVRRAQGFQGTGQALRHAEWGFALADAIADLPLQRAIDNNHENIALSALSLILVARGNWNDAVTYARELLNKYSHHQDYGWFERDMFFAEAVKHQFIPQARALLFEFALDERWEPLDRALALIEADDPAQLAAIAPEMREAVRLVLSRIAPDFLSPPD
ncbi:MAG: AAA family ATPase [Myxococcota bacterium]